MAHVWHGVRRLKREGKLHPRLTRRLYFLALTILALTGIAAYGIIQGASVVLTIVSVCAGYAMGYYLLRHKHPLQWNEAAALVETKRMTIFGWIVVGLFIALKIILTIAIVVILPESAETYLIAVFLGFLIGRFVGMLAVISELPSRRRR